MHHIGIGAVFLAEVDLFLRVSELLEGAPRAFVGGLVVSFHQVGDGHRLGAIFLADPVSVGQVDANWGRGEAVATQRGDDDALGRHALALLFLEARVDGRVVLKPLGVLAYGVGTHGSLKVLKVDDGLPGGLHAHRVVVVFDEAVHEVDVRNGVLHPCDVVFVPGLQVARGIIVDELLRVVALAIVLRHLVGLLQPADDGLDGLAVQAVGLVDVLIDLAVFLHQLGVQSIANRRFVVGLAHLVVEGFHITLTDIAFIEIHGRVDDDVVLAAATHLVEFLVEDDGRQEGDEVVDGLALVEREQVDIAALNQVSEIGLAYLGEELVLGIVVMDTVAEEHTLGIDHEVLEVGTLAVALIRVQHGLDGLADHQVILEVLVGKDVTTALGRLAEIIDVTLLLQRQLVPLRNLVTHDPQVGKLVHQILEFLFGLGLFGDFLLFRGAAHQCGSHSKANH